jgi:hypothetical protein
MTFEFQAAWQKMNAGGILLSDDIHMSNAFARFITDKRVGPVAGGQPLWSSIQGLMRPLYTLALEVISLNTRISMN